MMMLPLAAALLLSSAPDDWPSWRGPNGNGIAAEGPAPPSTWSDSRNVLWKTAIPGRGHGSPIVFGNRIYLATADPGAQTQSLLGLDRETGGILWTTEINRGGLPRKIHKKNTHASQTAACDGERVTISFFNNRRIQLAAVDLNGRILWNTTVHPFTPKKYEYGYSASPLLYKDSVIVAGDSDSGAFVTAFDRVTGKRRWTTRRASNLSWSSPIVGRVAGRDQLLISGSDRVASYDPATGRLLWSVRATTAATAGTMVWDAERVYASGGYPKPGTFAIRGDGSGKILWQNKVKCYEQSMLVTGDHLYAVDDRGTAYCWKAADGTERWSESLGGRFSASPTLSNGNICVPNEAGTFFVFRADPSRFTLVSRNQLGTDAFASPVVAGGRIYLRVGSGSGAARRETLYCIGARE